MIRYIGQLFTSMGKHLGEPALALVVAATISITYAGMGSKVPVMPLIVGILVFQFSVASWRVYRQQQISLATKQGLLDLDELDRDGHRETQKG